MEGSRIYLGKLGTDLPALNEVVNKQQQLLHKLYVELDQEREASETAACETLSMILRLQEEKAVVEMEAKQYKRIAEEKIFHAEECVATYEDLIYQKDMEIASLECQIQAYKYKLLSLGFDDSDCTETINYENAYLEKIESFYGEDDSGGQDVKMNNLSPPVYHLAQGLKARADSTAWENVTLFGESKTVAVDQELKVETADTLANESYWQQIKNLDERVNRIVNVKDAVKKQTMISQGSKTLADFKCSARVQDIFEVPAVSVSHNVGGKLKVEPEEVIARGEIRILKSGSPTEIRSLFKPEPKPKPCFNLTSENKSFKYGGWKNLDHYNLACSHYWIGNAESTSEIEQLTKRVEQLEKVTVDTNSRPEITAVAAEDPCSLKELLKNIQTHLSKIETDIKSLKTSKSKKHDDSALQTLQQEMLHFWL